MGGEGGDSGEGGLNESPGRGIDHFFVDSEDGVFSACFLMDTLAKFSLVLI